MDSTRQRIAEVADQMLKGKTGLLEGCRIIVAERTRLPEIEDAVFDVFVGVESELDDVPVGLARAAWTAEALARKDSQRDAYLAEVANQLSEACKALLAKYDRRTQ